MKRFVIAAALVGMAGAGVATAAEFQPLGAVGMGGAGVARTQGAYATYWNPAGLAFHDKSLEMRINGGAGMRVNDGLADNVDRLNKISFDQAKQLSTADAVGDAVKVVSLVDNIKKNNGILAINGDAVVAFQYHNFGFGAFGSLEGFARPDIDTTRIVPLTAAGTAAATPLDLYNAVTLPTAGYTPQYFSSAQIGSIATALSSARPATDPGYINLTQATQLANAIDAQLAAKPSGLSSADTAATITNTLAPALSGTGGTLDQNRTFVKAKSLIMLEFPIGYGYDFDLGSFGKLAVGGAVKVIAGRVYQSNVYLLKSGSTVKSSDIVSEMTKNYKETTTFGVDLGTLWKPTSALSIGLVAKNLNSPSFDSPDRVKDHNGNDVANTDGSVSVKPQVRMGAAWDLLNWLSIAADIDLTENDTIMQPTSYKSRNLGGGLEVHPWNWLKVRAGMYTNLAESASGPVATAGLTFGIPWFNLDIDGAYGLDTATYKEKSYPQEAKVQVGLNVQFD